MRLLLERGAEMEARDKDHSIPLHLAACNGHLVALRLLLERGANVEARDKYHRTPLHFATCNGLLAASRLLIENGASLDALADLARIPLHEGIVVRTCRHHAGFTGARCERGSQR